ncbi:LytR/AlgR family response regulator transcription factor [Taibaiella helva]|uniref:LytR/AlgR family response regulator transcription factor n=1 Tax=Taibaiella helva TaxID=2301235 RepID=UPI000E572998|nr:LytTR family DNA-binding domain-containing protein [Taibaiella helva]
MTLKSQKTRCLVVDDEPLAAGILRKYIGQLEDLELVATCGDAFEAMSLLQREPIDLMFLDIQLPGLTGIGLLKALSRPPAVVLTTAYREYAIEGFELQVLDYLVKPVPFERFLAAVNRFYALYRPPTRLPATMPPPGAAQEHAFLYLKADKKMIKVFLKDISYIESLKDYVRVRTADKVIITYQRISTLEAQLPATMFLRIHRSFIVAIDKISAFNMTAIEVGDTELPIGRQYKNQVLKALGL